MVVRLGHPARIMYHLNKYSLEAMVKDNPGNKVISDIRKQIK